MLVADAYQTTCRFCESIEANIMLSFAFFPMFLPLHMLQLKPRMLSCQAIIKKQIGSWKPCQSAADLQWQG